MSGNLYVTGGYDNLFQLLSDVEMYTPASNTWSATAPLPAARGRHAAVAVRSAIYVLGGRGGRARGANRATLCSVLKFDSTQGTWSEVAPMPAGRLACAACVIGSNIYMFGGFGGDRLEASVFKFDTDADEWTILADMPQACISVSANFLGGLVYIVGAGGSGRDVLCFDPVSGMWSTLASTLQDRQRGSSFVVAGSLYAAGEVYHPSSVERYDVASNTWTAVADMLEGRLFFGAVTIGSTGPAEEQNLFDSLIAKASR